MQRETVRISEAEMERQQEFQASIRSMFAEREAHPLACVETFGCQQNVADGQRLMGMLQACGFTLTDRPQEADVTVLNTCAVREHAEQRVFGNLGILSHVKKENPERIICLCGCMAAESRVVERLRTSYRHVDLVFDPQSLWRFPELLWQVYEKRERVFSVKADADSIAEGLPVVRENGVKAWVSIMYGCNNFCSYCIVPYVRGRERSRTPEAVLTEISQLVEAGYKDITLLGQNVNSYKGGDNFDFADLLAEADKIQGRYLLRFMTSHPKDASRKLFDTMARCDHVAKQLHLPVQSGSDRVLEMMRRRYTREQYLEKIHYARQVMPDLVLTSDVIVGFPGETEEEAMETISLVETVQYDALFTFLYSPRPGTKAAQLPDPVPREEKQKWFNHLLEVQNGISAKIHAGYEGKTVHVLVDGVGEDPHYPLTARTEGNRLVRVRGDQDAIGQFREAKISGSNTWALYGEII